MIDRSGVTRWNVFKFLVTKVPSVLWFGVKLKSISEDTCVVTMRRNWRNRNPYNSAYFAATLAAAEMATGLMLFDDIIEQGKQGTKLVASITRVEGEFIRPVVGPVEFTCNDGWKIVLAVGHAAERKHWSVAAAVHATNEAGKAVASILVTWQIRRIKE